LPGQLAPAASIISEMNSRQEPQPVPAPQWSPIWSTVWAPLEIAEAMSRLLAVLQKQTITADPRYPAAYELKVVFKVFGIKQKITVPSPCGIDGNHFDHLRNSRAASGGACSRARVALGHTPDSRRLMP
jgi:hypothetical protein